MFDAVVLGSGVSTAVPILSHILQRRCPVASIAVRRADGMTVCEEAAKNQASKNRRRNVSLLLRHAPAGGGPVRHIMVDAGKTMRQAALAVFLPFGVRSIDALLLTHGHADAILGMDDLRDLQVIEEFVENGMMVGYKLADGAGPIRIISNQTTLDRVREVFPYLCNRPDFSRPGVLRRRIGYVELDELPSDNASLEVHGVPVCVFPVWHGGTYVSLGFAFGLKKGTGPDGEDGHPLVYISDVSEVPPDSMAMLERAARGGIDLLIVDALRRNTHTTHFSTNDALSLIRRLRPGRSLLIGMDSCETGDHDEVNEELAALLASEGLDVQLAYDGMHLPAYAVSSRL